MPVWKMVFVLVWSTGWLQAQEVTTNEEGRKIVVDSNGQWRYFRIDDSLANSYETSVFEPSTSIAEENQLRLLASKQLEKEISLKLIEKRVVLIDQQLASQNELATANSRQSEQLKQTEAQIRQLETELAIASSRTEFLQKIAKLPPATYERKLKDWEEGHLQKKGRSSVNFSAPNAASAPGITKIANGILLLPPEQKCVGGGQIFDTETGEIQWNTALTELFSHTDAAFAQQFIKRDFVNCSGHLTAMQGGVRFLDLKIAVASNKAPQIFGVMPKDEFLEIQLLNGEIIRLFNILPKNGQWDTSLDAFVYQSRYRLGFREEKLLKSSEVDKVLVRWSKVQDKYAVFETDFFIRHFKCLDALFIEEN